MQPTRRTQSIVVDFDPAVHAELLEPLDRDGVLERWAVVGAAKTTAHLLVLESTDTGQWLGAALLTARENTAYLKIIDVLGPMSGVVEAVLDHARNQECVCVKWEWWCTSGEPDTAGFVELPAPGSAAGTGSPGRGYVYWLESTQHAGPTHYRQSENFTCAAAAALIAHGHSARPADDLQLRTEELTLWRRATNFMACDPIALGLAVRARWPESDVSVALDTSDPVIIDYYPEAERGWRAILQQSSRLQAAEEGLELSTDRLSMTEIREATRTGEQFLLLLSLERMLGYDVPHWVLCHGHSATALILDDPWIDSAGAETWVDATHLPVTDAKLDGMSSMETLGYRAAVRLGALDAVRTTAAARSWTGTDRP